jgi:hypothetical protein
VDGLAAELVQLCRIARAREAVMNQVWEVETCRIPAYVPELEDAAAELRSATTRVQNGQGAQLSGEPLSLLAQFALELVDRRRNATEFELSRLGLTPVPTPEEAKAMTDRALADAFTKAATAHLRWLQTPQSEWEPGECGWQEDQGPMPLDETETENALAKAANLREIAADELGLRDAEHRLATVTAVLSTSKPPPAKHRRQWLAILEALATDIEDRIQDSWSHEHDGSFVRAGRRMGKSLPRLEQLQRYERAIQRRMNCRVQLLERLQATRRCNNPN